MVSVKILHYLIKSLPTIICQNLCTQLFGNYNFFGGNFNIDEGTVEIQSDTALGDINSTTTTLETAGFTRLIFIPIIVPFTKKGRPLQATLNIIQVKILPIKISYACA